MTLVAEISRFVWFSGFSESTRAHRKSGDAKHFDCSDVEVSCLYLHSCFLSQLYPSIHIRLLTDDKMHQIQYENRRNISTIAYIRYEQ